ncbi:hypothetical protein [Archangium lipolyticum]|uniref:hypothetical protein n=1 Tax=Archangium lipolyticum TaxID=2970465 RepID=UPI00214A5268|nr:hypothetical protein [Archangium lipolyticum]
MAVLLLAGGVLLIAGWTARASLNPDTVALSGVTFQVLRRVEPESVVFDLTRPDGGVAVSISGSTDTLCDPPYLMAIDVDQNGSGDVYYRHCRGHGYVTYQNGAPVDVDLGQYEVDDAPAAASFWANEIQAGGLRLLTSGTVVTLVALAMLAVWLSSACRVRHMR